jgi:predicted nuclease of restriction endonuclease-like (RecB) superfamily
VEQGPVRARTTLPADAQVRDPFVLEFSNLRAEFSETELENALIQSLASSGFC